MLLADNSCFKYQIRKDTPLKILLSFLFCFTFASVASAGTYNYAEIGFGLSKLTSSSDDKAYDDTINDADPSGAFKISTGSRLGHSVNNWFELTYIYEAPKKIDTTEISNHLILVNLKFTTDPKADFSAFFKLGGGKAFTEIISESEASDFKSSVYSGSLGTSFRLNAKQAINFEAQSIYNEDSTKLYNNFFVVSLNQFI